MSAALAFLSMFMLDIVYTKFLHSVHGNRPFTTSLWSAACYLLGSTAVIAYTSDHWLLIPAALGAFGGTYVGMKLKP